MLYSDTASVHFRFEDSADTASFVNAAFKMHHKKGESRLDIAIGVAITDVFPTTRVGIPKIAFVITSGRQSPDTQDLHVVSEPLRKAKVKMITLHVGTEVNQQEWRSIVSSDEDILQADSYDQLLLERRNVSQKICEAASKLTPVSFTTGSNQSQTPLIVRENEQLSLRR